jgi:hypothetical protein
LKNGAQPRKHRNNGGSITNRSEYEGNSDRKQIYNPKGTAIANKHRILRKIVDAVANKQEIQRTNMKYQGNNGARNRKQKRNTKKIMVEGSIKEIIVEIRENG